MRCPPIRSRRPGSGCPTVRCPVTWGRRPEVRRSAVCCPPVQRPAVRCPTVRCPAVWCLPPVHPDASVSFHLRRWQWRPGRGGRVTLTTRTGGGPCGYRAVDGFLNGRGDRHAGDAAQVAVVSGRSVADPGRRVGCGPRRPRLSAERPGRPGRRAEHPSRAAGAVAREQGCSARWRHRPRGWRPRLGGRPRCVVVAEPAARMDGPGRADGLAGGNGRAAPARPRLAASIRGLLPTAL